MSKFTLEEASFIIANHPDVKLESCEISSEINVPGEESILEACVFAEERCRAYTEGTPSEVFYLTLHLRDTHGTLPRHYVRFDGPAQLYTRWDSEEIDYVFPVTPGIIDDTTARDDGRFSVTLPFMIRDCDPEEDTDEHHVWTLYDKLCAKNKSIYLNLPCMHVANEFVEENFSLNVRMTFANDGRCKLPFPDKQRISYDLAVKGGSKNAE